MNTAATASSAHTTLIDRYFDAWNERDGARRRALIDATYGSDAAYRDPLMAGDGHAGIDTMIAAVHERFPAYRFRRTTDVDGFGEHLRFSWSLVSPDGAALVKGSDFGVVDASGRLKSVVGFIDEMPAAAA
ncbi:polyketide cyclase [Burkholderia vietnamiensis]|uniref:nuclear transport factor 2 family protein n=1 Tax=Burkholderia vietnamiensis TaxID=60552 RepID=UPI00075775A7|nr:nuclear transport factor 2 family protein [Burkholderia vietnamiensis]KVF16848.1 polyketide cyclase [Burkholderia vietnamiensis]HDR9056083.1 nuclear transport factor 2 family protein [Burkholderia vietnamiensis]HDR9356331.1 nuclear transport factor 2 family protein [Burkholderia vietnamiensis]